MAFALNVRLDPYQMGQLLDKLGGIVAALDDVKKAISDLGTSISAEIQAVENKISALITAGGDSISATDAAGLVTDLQSVRAKVDAETAKVSA